MREFFCLRQDLDGYIVVLMYRYDSHQAFMRSVAYWNESQNQNGYNFIAINDACVRRILPDFYRTTRSESGSYTGMGKDWPLPLPKLNK
jgi:hypothetical protein